MMAALPGDRARKACPAAQGAGARQGRRASSTRRFPLAAKTIDALGTKTGAWSTTITYDAADITTDNLEAVRRGVSRQHYRRLPRRSGQRHGDRGAPAGAARVRPRRQGTRRASTRRRDSYHRRRAGAAPPARAEPAQPAGDRSARAAHSRRSWSVRAIATRSESSIGPRWTVWPTRGSPRSTRERPARLAQPDFALFALLVPNPRGADRAAAAGSRHSDRHLARVQQDDRRLLQVPLAGSAADHR